MTPEIYLACSQAGVGYTQLPDGLRDALESDDPAVLVRYAIEHTQDALNDAYQEGYDEGVEDGKREGAEELRNAVWETLESFDEVLKLAASAIAADADRVEPGELVALGLYFAGVVAEKTGAESAADFAQLPGHDIPEIVREFYKKVRE